MIATEDVRLIDYGFDSKQVLLNINGNESVNIMPVYKINSYIFTRRYPIKPSPNYNRDNMYVCVCVRARLRACVYIVVVVVVVVVVVTFYPCILVATCIP